MPTVTLSPILGAYQKVTDNVTNEPLVGAKIYTYESGTLTPCETYTTSAGNVANSNPIITNSAGFPSDSQGNPVSIYIRYDKTYRFIIKTAGDVLIGDYSGIKGYFTTVVGTPHQIIVTTSGGVITIGAPQDIDVISSPTFKNLNLLNAGSTTALAIGDGSAGSDYVQTINSYAGIGQANRSLYSMLLNNGQSGSNVRSAYIKFLKYGASGDNLTKFSLGLNTGGVSATEVLGIDQTGLVSILGAINTTNDLNYNSGKLTVNHTTGDVTAAGYGSFASLKGITTAIPTGCIGERIIYNINTYLNASNHWVNVLNPTITPGVWSVRGSLMVTSSSNNYVYIRICFNTTSSPASGDTGWTPYDTSSVVGINSYGFGSVQLPPLPLVVVAANTTNTSYFLKSWANGDDDYDTSFKGTLELERVA